MLMVRVIGITMGIVLSLLAAILLKVELTSVLAMAAFIVSIDTAVMRFVSYIYMKTVIEEMNKNEKHDSDISS